MLSLWYKISHVEQNYLNRELLTGEPDCGPWESDIVHAFHEAQMVRSSKQEAKQVGLGAQRVNVYQPYQNTNVLGPCKTCMA
jgi:hypothetical protein